jgi:hypothetical protein
MIATPFNMTLAFGALPGEGVTLPVDEGDAVPVEELSVAVSDGEAVAVGAVDVSEALVESSPVAEGVAVAEMAEDEVVVVNLIPQTFSGSKVNSMPLPSHPKLCRWMESGFRRYQISCSSAYSISLVKGSLPGITEGAQFLAIQQKYLSRYFCWVHMHAASFVQEPGAKLPKKQSF